MRGHFVVGSFQAFVEPNIYADKSSLVLEWLLQIGMDKSTFSIREVAKDTGVSLGLVQMVFGYLIMHGYLHAEGIRTAKTFSNKKPQLLLSSWLEHYSIIKKCKMRTYHTGLQDRAEVMAVLKKSSLRQKTALALHSAAEALGCQNTNLSTVELYLLEPPLRPLIEQLLQLEPQERGYEVLLIEPYYKSMLYTHLSSQNGALLCASPLLTFIDLYHFPLRGREQAEFLAERIASLKRVYRKP